jgi:hypothetical protein
LRASIRGSADGTGHSSLQERSYVLPGIAPVVQLTFVDYRLINRLVPDFLSIIIFLIYCSPLYLRTVMCDLIVFSVWST